MGPGDGHGPADEVEAGQVVDVVSGVEHAFGSDLLLLAPLLEGEVLAVDAVQDGDAQLARPCGDDRVLFRGQDQQRQAGAAQRGDAEAVAAVRGVDLAIKAGEFFSLLGPSGCGKTTTMRMIAGFEDPTDGVVRLAGHDVTGVPPNHRDINMVFQSFALFPHLSVSENVAFGLKRKKVDRAEIKRRVADMHELVAHGDHAKRPP
jgi:ABC-type glutathione transport system ATPase component